MRSTYGYEPIVYGPQDSSSELKSGIVFCKVKSWLTGRRLVSLPFSDHCDALLESRAELGGLISPLREMVDNEKWTYCEIRPTIIEPAISAIFGQNHYYVLHAIDLQPRIDVIYGKFHHSVRRKIKRAEREGLTSAEGISELLLGQFYKLLVATRKRQCLPPQPKEWFRNLIANFGVRMKIRIAYHQNTPIAGVLTLNHKNTVTYKYGCSDARWHPLGGVALVFWNMIQEAKAKGYEKLDLGRSKISNNGLIVFKENWGGVSTNLHYWRYPNLLQSHESLRNKAIMGQIVKSAPDPLLSAMGNLLYRHVG